MTIKKQIDNKKIFKKIDFDSRASKLKMKNFGVSILKIKIIKLIENNKSIRRILGEFDNLMSSTNPIKKQAEDKKNKS